MMKSKKKNNLISFAFSSVNREKFVPLGYKEWAYDDTALPIGEGQTISQPSTIAFMLSLLDVQDNQKILEVGSGSGYVLALLSKINPNGSIIGVERIKSLFDSSVKNLRVHKNIQVFHGNGFNGLKEEAPFDRILVSASATEIPKELIKQLRIGGKLVVPVQESIVALKKFRNKTEIREHEGFVFVPLIKD